MNYQCQDCSHTQQGQFPGGCCPACGSFNIHRNRQDAPTEERKTKGKRWRLLVSIALWIVLAYLIYQKL